MRKKVYVCRDGYALLLGSTSALVEACDLQLRVLLRLELTGEHDLDAQQLETYDVTWLPRTQGCEQIILLRPGQSPRFLPDWLPA